MYRIARQVRVGDMALDAMHDENAPQGAPAAIFHHVPDPARGRGFAHQAPINGLAACLQFLDDLDGAVYGRPLFIAGDQKGDRTFMVRMPGDETFAGRDHRGQRTLHVRRTPSVQEAIANRRLERIMRTGWHHIGVACETEDRPRTTTPRPKILHVAERQRLGAETLRREALHHQRLTAGVFRADRCSPDQVKCEL